MQIEATTLDDTLNVGRVDREKNGPRTDPWGKPLETSGRQERRLPRRTNKLRQMVKVRPYPCQYPTGDAEITVQTLQQNLVVHRIKSSCQIQQS